VAEVAVKVDEAGEPSCNSSKAEVVTELEDQIFATNPEFAS
jgi:hypothetical protein